MRVTCLKCGSQYDVAYDTSSTTVNCECGPSFTYPEVHYTGVQPSERAAERLRYRAFHSAGLVRDIGTIALTVSAVSIIFFPLAIVGIGVGLYTLLAKRGPLGRYVGRSQAAAAVALGLVVFCAEGALLLDVLEKRRARRVVTLQTSIRDDLRGLLRTQRLFRAAQDRYGRFDDFPGRGFRPVSGYYTIYLGRDDFVVASRDGAKIQDDLPSGFSPGVSDDAFTAIAVANIDSDPDVDVWMLNHSGEQVHLADDNDYAPDVDPGDPGPELPPARDHQDPGSAEGSVAEGGAPPSLVPFELDLPEPQLSPIPLEAPQPDLDSNTNPSGAFATPGAKL